MSNTRFGRSAPAAVLGLALSGAAAFAQQNDTGRIEHEALPYTVIDGKVDRSTYVGWRLFNSTCHICHGVDATGTTVAPDLVRRVKPMSADDFIVAVLYRYPIIIGFDAVASDDLTAIREAFIEEVKKHQRGELTMPVWDHDPNVKPHILDLYAYLRARADGALGEGRPEPIEP